ncbi:MAG: nucleotide exchange factor GrpE [Actinomycetota bacterium]|nr:nucleotide exchange factor GrpE [Actinomycetota bacterium]
MSSEEQRRQPDEEPDQEIEATNDASENNAENAGGDPGPIEEPWGSASDPASIEYATDDVEYLMEEEPGVAEEELSVLAAELEGVRRERDEYLESLRRLKAEFENSRKRQERDRERILQSASEKLVAELLPVLDNLDRALEADGDVREGVRATRDHFVDVLGREGLVSVASDGQAFDPNVHEAVMGQPSDEHEDGTILQTFQRGYILNGKPIRAAKVVVAKQV